MTGGRRGGPGRGQGRKPLTPGTASVVVTLRMTKTHKERLKQLGGSKWVREQIENKD